MFLLVTHTRPQPLEERKQMPRCLCSCFVYSEGDHIFDFLQDITELEKLEVLTSLSELSLIDNPVSIGSVG